MCRSFWILGFGLAILAVSGCAGSTPKVATVSVKGTVTIDGKPMPDGEIYFSTPGQPLTMFPVKEGAFSGNAQPGSNRVEIRAYKEGPPLSTDVSKTPTKQNFIPDRFSVQSKLTAEVGVGGANDLKFVIASK